MRIWFRNLRKEMNLTQMQMAELVGFDYRLISKIEVGGSIKVTTAKQIAKVLNIDWKKFYEET